MINTLCSAWKILQYPDGTIEKLRQIIPELQNYSLPILERVQIQGLYDVYLSKQSKEIRIFKQDESIPIPCDLNFSELNLSLEVVEKLTKYRPTSLVSLCMLYSIINIQLIQGMLKRMEGITPDAIARLLRHIRRNTKRDTDFPKVE